MPNLERLELPRYQTTFDGNYVICNTKSQTINRNRRFGIVTGHVPFLESGINEMPAGEGGIPTKYEFVFKHRTSMSYNVQVAWNNEQF